MDTGAEDLRALRQVFATEAAEQLAVLEQTLLGLEARPDDRGALATVFRAAHTIKGGASMVELDTVAAFAHSLEGVLEDLREGGRSATPEIITLLLQGVDVIRSLVDGADAKDDASLVARASLVAELARWRASAPSEAVEAAADGIAAPPDPAESPAELAPHPQPDLGGPPAVEGKAGRPVASPSSERALRIEVDKLDRLLEAVGELAVWRRGFAAALEANETPMAEELTVAFTQGDRMLEEARDAVMEMRLVPLGPFLRRLSRPVRDIARSAGKDVVLVVEGEEVQVDTAVAERIVDPLVHLVRNAVDHGIEHGTKREAVGKSPRGTVAVRAYRDAAGLVVEVADDGAGLSRSRVVERALAWGVTDAEDLPDAELWELIFHPGFSTARAVSEISGRGVGMDAVRRTVEAMRGSIEIRSREGAGTTVVLRLPVTLAVIHGLEVLVGEDTYVLPLDGVERCVPLPGGTAPGATGVFDLDGVAIPLVGLGELFGCTGPIPKDGRSVVLVRQGPLVAGLVVDGLIGDAETVIKPLGGRLAGLSGIGGSAVLDDGRVGLVIDLPGLLRWAAARGCAAGDAAGTGRTNTKRGVGSTPVTGHQPEAATIHPPNRDTT